MAPPSDFTFSAGPEPHRERRRRLFRDHPEAVGRIYGEIDIVVRYKGQTIFVEVKTRTSNKMGLPEESITPRKRQHMLAAAEHYAAEHDLERWQIDVIAIEGKPGKQPNITYFENAL